MYLNYRKVMVAGATAAVIVGAGGTALAATGSDSTGGTGSSSTATKTTSAHHGKGGLLRRLEHGQFVTRGANGTTVTHDLIRGSVTAVSATSITVQAADKTSETFAITKDTKVTVKVKGQKPTASTISKIANGDRVFVAGTGTTTFTAQRVAELPKQ